jgi:hypothetical protein
MSPKLGTIKPIRRMQNSYETPETIMSARNPSKTVNDLFAF